MTEENKIEVPAPGPRKWSTPWLMQIESMAMIGSDAPKEIRYNSKRFKKALDQLSETSDVLPYAGLFRGIPVFSDISVPFGEVRVINNQGKVIKIVKL